MIVTLASLPLWVALTGSSLFAPDPGFSRAPGTAQDPVAEASGDDEPEVPLIQDLGEYYLLTFDEQDRKSVV